MKKFCIAVLAAVLPLSFASTAAAQVERSQWEKEGGYHIFKDDPLTAPGAVPGGIGIRVRPPPLRSLLIRPRVSFVPEMLKSVEKM